jgi:hypothetical protein
MECNFHPPTPEQIESSSFCSYFIFIPIDEKLLGVLLTCSLCVPCPAGIHGSQLPLEKGMLQEFPQKLPS